jgi:hypothetical protein
MSAPRYDGELFQVQVEPENDDRGEMWVLVAKKKERNGCLGVKRDIKRERS